MTIRSPRSARRALLSAGLAAGLAAAFVQAPAAEADCAAAVGTYLTSISDREGVFSSRGLMTFAAGGVLTMSDSAQGGVPGAWDPFSSSQGAWRCEAGKDGTLDAAAVALNFVLPADGRRPALARVDYKIHFEPGNGAISGSATLHLTDGMDLEAANPMEQPGKLMDEFQFDGVRVTLP